MPTSGPSVEIVTRGGHPDFLDLPWGQPLEDWDHPRLVKMAHGISRHVVRFVRYDDRAYALKQTTPHAAWTEYRVLRALREAHLPVVEPVGLVTPADPDGPAMLITRYLDFSLPYWYVIGRDDQFPGERLLDAAVVLLVRLHLEGVFWGDCSLSNILWRRDAGAMMAYLVDAETTERHPSISDGMRHYDLAIAEENIAGGLLELQAAGRVDPGVDALALAQALRIRYEELWTELTREDEFGLDQRWCIEYRVRRINDLGFDVEELAISRDSQRLTLKPVLVEEGHHARELRRRTGLEVQENQARRLLADIAQYGAWLESNGGRPVPAAVAAARWLADVYEPVVESIPPELSAHLEAAELFHHLLEHRYYLSEKLGREISNQEALDDYLETVLKKQRAEKQLEVGEADAPTAWVTGSFPVIDT